MIGSFSIVKPEVPMTHERMSPLRERMLEDMRIRGMGDKAQKNAYPRHQGFCEVSEALTGYGNP